MKNSPHGNGHFFERTVLILISSLILIFVIWPNVRSASANNEGGQIENQAERFSQSPIPTPTWTPTPIPIPPTPTDTPVPPTPTDTPVPPTNTPTPIPPTPTDTPVPNYPPEIIDVTGPTAPVNINDQPVSVNVIFSDPNIGDTHKVIWQWGDGTAAITQNNTTSPAMLSHSYASPGVYTVRVVVTDAGGLFDSDKFEFIVIFDPGGGFVTGGGWLDSPPDAYTPDPTLSGRATFGFVSKYKKGANAPIGNTQFQFKAADVNFHSTSYQWLVVNGNGSRAQFKGEGLINGGSAPNGEAYKFLIWAVDGIPDTMRIKIWYVISNVDFIVYDNGVVTSEFGQPIGGGSIVVHRGN